MPVFFKEDRSILFVHVPKAGGSTVERVLTTSGWTMKLRETMRTHPNLMRLRRCSPQHYHASLLSEMFAVERFDLVFMVTRDPVSRFRSEYLMRNHRDPRTDAASVDSWGERMLDRYAADPYVMDNHLRPQNEFHLPGSEVYRLEDGLESILGEVSARFGLGLTSDVPHRLDSTARAGVSSSAVQVSEKLATRLHELYAEDFRRYGYPR